MNRPKCFVAMAFDRADTDALYDRAILPILKRNGITPVIINRHQSNEDLNNQIITQLRSCDFAVVDLTYARPSVYFEAGFAQRAVEVIYSVRSDHFERGQPDGLKVHFDLRMKPMLRWRKPADKEFMRSLEKRLRSTVLVDWQKRVAQAEKDAAEKTTFSSMSEFGKLGALRTAGVHALSQLGFRDWREDEAFGLYGPSSLRHSKPINYFEAIRGRHKRIEIATLQVFPALRKATLDEVRPLFAKFQFRHDIDVIGRGKEGVVVHRIVLALRRVSNSHLASTFSHLRQGAGPGDLIYEMTSQVGKPSAELPVRVNLHAITGLTSERTFMEALRASL